MRKRRDVSEGTRKRSRPSELWGMMMMMECVGYEGEKSKHYRSTLSDDKCESWNGTQDAKALKTKCKT